MRMRCMYYALPIGLLLWCIIITTGCATLDKAREIVDAIRDKPEVAQPEVVQPIEPDPEPEPINRGGDGLYKPESSLWLLPRGIRAATIKTAGEYRPDGSLVKWFRLGGNSEPFADGSQPIRDHAGMYHPQHQDLGGVKLRAARATCSGNVFRTILRDGRVLEKLIQNKDVRQE